MTILPAKRCSDCYALLSRTEIKYYGMRCEKCEQEACDRLNAWRLGAADAELDALYTPADPVKH